MTPVPSVGPDAERAREEIRAIATEKGHSVDVARRAGERLEVAFADGSLQRTPVLEAMLRDLGAAIQAGEGEKLGGKSGEAARMILRAIVRAVDSA